MGTSGPVIGVLALQGDVREHRAMLSRCGVPSVAVRRPEELPGLDGIVLPGGESTTMHRLARAFGLFDPLRDAVRGGLPAFGTCAGMILLADQLDNGTAGQETIGGLDVVVRRNAFGRQVDSFESTVRFEPSWSAPFDFPATFIRAPWVEKAGSGVEVVARTVAPGHAHRDGDGVADRNGATPEDRIVGVRRGRLLATSFHPEITGDARIHQLFVDLVREG